MSTTEQKALDVLIQYATGQIHHLNLGMCPDEVEGPDVRDPGCQVCQAIDAAGLLSAENEALRAQVEALSKPAIQYSPGEWFQAASVDEMQAFFESRLPAIREAARAHGYAIGVHGSMRRDLDLIAAPWRDGAADAETLAHAIAKAACGMHRQGAYTWEEKPLGRVATCLPICWTDRHDVLSDGHIDLSVMPQLLTRASTDMATQAEAATVHKLKILPDYFEAQLSGRKTFELRKDDRGYKVGDVLFLQEYTGAEYTGREINCSVLGVLNGPIYGLAEGFVILSTARLATPSPLTRPAVPETEVHEPKCPALDGGDCICTRNDKHDQAVDRSWARFCAKFGDGPDAPYPGMISAFERYYSQSFADKEWRTESAVWAAAWKAAMLAAAPQPEVQAEVRPDIQATSDSLEAMERDAGRYRKLRRGQRWSVINWIGDALRGEELDAAVDSFLAPEAQPTEAAQKGGA